MSEPSSSRDRELNWEYTEDKVTVVKTKKGKCQFMVPSNKDSLRGKKKQIEIYHSFVNTKGQIF